MVHNGCAVNYLMSPANPARAFCRSAQFPVWDIYRIISLLPYIVLFPTSHCNALVFNRLDYCNLFSIGIITKAYLHKLQMVHSSPARVIAKTLFFLSILHSLCWVLFVQRIHVKICFTFHKVLPSTSSPIYVPCSPLIKTDKSMDSVLFSLLNSVLSYLWHSSRSNLD